MTMVLDGHEEHTPRNPWDAAKLTAYLKSVGGREVLECQSYEHARETASAINILRIPGLEVAQFGETVRLKLRVKP